MSVVEVHGKSTRKVRKVYVLLSNDMVEGIDHLLATRIHAGIDPSNPYMFARTKETPLDRCTAMRYVTQSCPGLSKPNLIRSRLLRKYLATTSQVMAMTQDELKLVADHMGHSLAIHTDVYRLQTSVLERTKVARALVALEEGKLTKSNSNQDTNLSTIDLDDLPAPLLQSDDDDEEEEGDQVEDKMEEELTTHNSDINEESSTVTAANTSKGVHSPNETEMLLNETGVSIITHESGANLTNSTSPSLEFWLHNVLRKSDGLENMGEVQWHLVISTFVGWAFVVAALIKGVHSLGKVVYVTAVAPYVLLTVLLIRGLTLDGAFDGVIWYVTPDFEKLASPQVWLDAAIQVFYSLGPTYGGVITMASHNNFHQKSIIETAICVGSDAFTAFYAGLCVFACIGFMAHEAGVSVEEAAKSSGPGLAFVAYPEAINRMPLPQLWSVLFFLMLTTVIFDSTFGMYETVTGTIIDLFPHFFRRTQWVVLIVVALLLFLLSIPFSMNGGIYLFQLADWYVSAFALLFGSALESIMICWIYGADRFARDIEMMTGRKSSVLLRSLWCICLTGFLTTAFFITVSTYKSPDYGDGYVYQPYAISIGLAISIIPLIPIPIVMIKEIYFAEGTILQRIRTLLQPSPKWQPHDEQAREIYKMRPYRYEDTLIKRIKRDLRGDKETPWI